MKRPRHLGKLEKVTELRSSLMDNPALVKAHEKLRGFNITFYFLSFKKSCKKFISIPDIPFVVTLMLYIVKSL